MKHFIFTLVLFLISGLASANQLGKTIKLNSKFLGEEREIVISLPAEYESEPFYRFPVLYLTDAFSQFDHTSSTLNYYSGAFSPMIVVGIQTPNRTAELKPYDKNQKLKTKPEQLRQFIVEEVKPYIQEHYRTEDYSIFAGHSYGGSFATHVYLSGPNDFDAFLIFAPNYAQGNEAMFSKLAETFKQKLQPNVFFQFEEITPFTTPIKSYHTLSKLLLDAPHLKETHRVQLLPGEDHMSVTHAGLLKAFNELYRDWFLYIPPVLADKSAFVQHYNKLSKRMGYEVKPTETNLWEFVSVLINQKHIDTALLVANQALKHYPDSHFTYSLLADVAQAQGNKKAQTEYLLQAIRLASKDQKRQARYQKKLAEIDSQT